MSKNSEKSKDDLQKMNETLSVSEQFIEKNEKSLLIALGVIILIVCGVMLFRHSYVQPKEKEAEEMIFKGENYFAVDSFNVALHGDGAGYIGFEGIIDDYGITKTAKLASAYAGLCYKNLGDYKKAVKFLNKCNAEDIMVSPALVGSIGDCYVEMKDYKKAAEYFEKASSVKNQVLAPIYMMKCARVYEKTKDYGKALKVYERIKKEYPLSQEGSVVEKYIDRAKTLK